MYNNVFDTTGHDHCPVSMNRFHNIKRWLIILEIIVIVFTQHSIFASTKTVSNSKFSFITFIETPENFLDIKCEENNLIPDTNHVEVLQELNNVEHQDSASLLISMIKKFLDIDQIDHATYLINQISTLPLTSYQRISLKFQKIKLIQKLGKHKCALHLLNQINIFPLNKHLRAEQLLLIAQSKISLNQLQEAVHTLLLRDRILTKSEKHSNQEQIMSCLNSMDSLNLSLLKENSDDPSIHGWIALSEIFRFSNKNEFPIELKQWKLNFFTHPLETSLFQKYAERNQIQTFRHIALLLPISSSSFGIAAKAFYDGFIAARNSDLLTKVRPTIDLHDIGEESELIKFYYQLAVNEGADFIVGPLGHHALDVLLKNNDFSLPTLVISDIPKGKSKVDLYGFGLSPNIEATKIAEKAYNDGHRNAIIIRPHSSWGDLVANSFEEKWKELGGEVVQHRSFPKDISDYTYIIQDLLRIHQSMDRHRVLSKQIGVRLHFTPRRRNDMDFIFLVANNLEATLLVPQIKFFQAHDVPIYATSYIFLKKPNPAINADLDGVIFGEIQWIAEGIIQRKKDINDRDDENQVVDRSTQKLKNLVNSDYILPDIQTFQNSPYESIELNRLYALGFQSYQLIPRLKMLSTHRWMTYSGEKMTISVNNNGNIEHHPTWVTFRSGLLESID